MERLDSRRLLLAGLLVRRQLRVAPTKRPSTNGSPFHTKTAQIEAALQRKLLVSTAPLGSTVESKCAAPALVLGLLVRLLHEPDNQVLSGQRCLWPELRNILNHPFKRVSIAITKSPSAEYGLEGL